MAIQPQTSRIRVTNTLAGFREWIATADAQDYAAGSLVTITLDTNVSASNVPAQPTALHRIQILNATGGVVYEVNFDETILSDQIFTFYMTDNGLVGGVASCDMLEINLRVQSTTFGQEYSIESDGSPTSVPVGWSQATDRGWIRGSTTATLVPSLTSAAYGESPTLTLTLAHQTFIGRNVDLGIGPDVATRTGGDGRTTFSRSIVIDEDFPAAATLYTPHILYGDGQLRGVSTGQPWLVLTTLTPTDITVDPRVTAEHHLQVDASDFATPPDSHANRKADFDRLTAELAFVGFRMVNAKGAGVNGLTVTETLRDNANLVGNVVNRSVTTATMGGEAGWCPSFATWDEVLPGGIWIHALDITAPADIDGSTYLLEASENFILLAPNPNYRVVVGGGPNEALLADGDKDHWHPGDPFLVGLALMNTSIGSMELLTPDADPAPRVVIGRFNQALGRAEYYDSTDSTWKSAGSGATITSWTLSASPGDAQVFIRSFTAIETEDWDWSDIFLIGIAVYNGTPYSGPANVPVMDKANGHGRYKLDAVGLALSGAIGFK